MSAAMTQLPPTINALDHEQRLRFMKSARKLEALLGTTPRLLEQPTPSHSSTKPGSPYSRSASPTGSFLRAPSPAPSSLSRSSSRASHRSARIYSSSNSSVSTMSFESFDDNDSDSVSSYTSTSPEPSPTYQHSKPGLSLGADLPPRTPKAKKFAEPTLYLRLHGTSAKSSLDLTDDDDDGFPTATPGKVFKAPLSPISPTMENRQEQLDFKRKKMAKLARTLGENVPPELVFPGQVQKQHSSRIRSNSVDERRFSGSLQQQQQKVIHHAASVSFDDGAAGVSPSKARVPSTTYSRVNVEIPRDIAKYYPERAKQRDSPDSDDTIRERKEGRVKGKEWSGQWNCDMEDVMSKLRKL